MTEADQQIQQAKSESSSCLAHVRFLLAMAHHKRNHDDESRQWFAQAVQWKKQYWDGDASDDAATILWNRRTTLELLDKEASNGRGIVAGE